MVKPIRVMVVDDHPVIADSLEAITRGTPDILMVGVAFDVESAIRTARHVRPTLVLLDVCLRDGANGLSLVRLLQAEDFSPQALIFTATDRNTYLDQALKLSVRGFLLKTATIPELLDASRLIAGGGYAFSLDISNRLSFGMEGLTLKEAFRPRTACLATREHEVLVQFARGLAVKEIAAEMHLSRKTIDSYKARAMKKLGVHRSAELLRLCYEEGLTAAPLPPARLRGRA
jgi:DNA-binding NarL/FixJ family response regulator